MHKVATILSVLVAGMAASCEMGWGQQILGGGGGGSASPSGWVTTKVDATHLSVSVNAQALNVAGTLCTNPPVPAVLSSPTGTGVGFIYMDTVAGCVLTAGSNAAITGDANITIAPGTVTTYAPGSYPIATFTFTGGAFGTVTNVTSQYSAYPIIAGTNVSVNYSGGVSIVSFSPPSAAFGALTDAATVAWAIGSAQNANASLTFTVHGGSRTLNLTGPVNGGNYVLWIKQDATGGEGLTLGTGCVWKVSGGGGGAITPSTGANAVDVLAFTYDGTNCYANFNKNFN